MAKTRSCRECREPINRKARRCPHCTSLQRSLSPISKALFAIAGFGLVATLLSDPVPAVSDPVPTSRSRPAETPSRPTNVVQAPAVDSKEQACVERGISYFKEIGSYPKLATAPNKGRLAADVARERCGRTVTAF